MDKHQEEILENRHMEDEIDLWELIQVVWRYKWLIVILFVVAVGVSAFVSKKMTPVYKVSTNYLIAKPEIITPSEAVSLFNMFFKDRSGKLGGINYPLQKPNVISGKNNIITISFNTTAGKKDMMAFQKELGIFFNKFLPNVMKPKVESDMGDLNGDISNCKDKLKLIDQRIREEERTVKNLLEKYKVMESRNPKSNKGNKEGMFTAMILLQNKILSLQQDLFRQKSVFLSTESDLKDLRRIKNEKMKLAKGENILVCLMPPTRSANPVKPRLFLNLAISGVLALFVGVFLAFFIEFIRKNRAKPVSG